MRAIKTKTWGLMSQASTNWILLEGLIASSLLYGFFLGKKYNFCSNLCVGMSIKQNINLGPSDIRIQMNSDVKLKHMIRNCFDRS